MKTLYVLRHSKSSWDDPFCNDHDRPLAPRGLKAASLMGQVLGSFENPPTLALSSSAQRARQTTELVLQTFQTLALNPPDLQIDSQIYEASVHTVVNRLAELPNQHDSVMLVGHNPTLEELVALLCFQQNGGRVQMPTGTLACLTFGLNDWQDLPNATGVLNALIFPRLVKSLLSKKSC